MAVSPTGWLGNGPLRRRRWLIVWWWTSPWPNAVGRALPRAAMNSARRLSRRNRKGRCLSEPGATIRAMKTLPSKPNNIPDEDQFIDDEHRLYLAGKIAKKDWRHSVVHGLMPLISGREDKTGWPIHEHALGHGVHYTGPFFLSDDHGCTHGPSTHGRGHDCGDYGGDTRGETVRLCYQAIDRSTALFAWLDDPSAHGTLVEIGYAQGRGIPVFVGTPDRDDARIVRSKRPASDTRRPPMWFALESADVHIEARTPKAALETAIGILNYWRYGYCY